MRRRRSAPPHRRRGRAAPRRPDLTERRGAAPPRCRATASRSSETCRSSTSRRCRRAAGAPDAHVRVSSATDVLPRPPCFSSIAANAAPNPMDSVISPVTGYAYAFALPRKAPPMETKAETCASVHPGARASTQPKKWRTCVAPRECATSTTFSPFSSFKSSASRRSCVNQPSRRWSRRGDRRQS